MKPINRIQIDESLSLEKTHKSTLLKLMSTHEKILEAIFFLELLDAAEERSKPLTLNGTVKKEISYLFGAILNSMYSALEHAKSTIGEEAVVRYKKQNPELFGGRGIRNTTIHERHVESNYSGYIPPKGNAVNFNFHPTPRLIQEEQHENRSATFNLRPIHYINYNNEPVEISSLCHRQILLLEKFLKQEGAI